jgi:hypothetical protein
VNSGFSFIDRAKNYNEMWSITQPIIMSTLLATAWVSAVLLKVTHNDQKYWLCSVDHEFPADVKSSEVPFRFVGDKVCGKGPNESRFRMMEGTTIKPIWIGNGLPNTDHPKWGYGKFEQAKIRFESTVGALQEDLGYFILVTVNEPGKIAKVEPETWTEILKANRNELQNAVARENNRAQSVLKVQEANHH